MSQPRIISHSFACPRVRRIPHPSSLLSRVRYACEVCPLFSAYDSFEGLSDLLVCESSYTDGRRAQPLLQARQPERQGRIIAFDLSRKSSSAHCVRRSQHESSYRIAAAASLFDDKRSDFSIDLRKSEQRLGSNDQMEENAASKHRKKQMSLKGNSIL